ncbi:MAG: hypothetical protein IPM39_04325 [Chloroflexi bacterium]|nr:hypothetical protein [Chloroflexota bacterium]
MALPETTTHSFIVRIWLEETLEEMLEASHKALWRGHITHVPSQKRRYFEDLNDIIAFIAPYLEVLGVQPGNTRGHSMSSIFSFLRGRPDNLDNQPETQPQPTAGTETVGALFTGVGIGPAALETPVAMPRAAAAVALSAPFIPHNAPSPTDVLTALRAALEFYLPVSGVGLPTSNVSIIQVEEKSAGLGNYIGQESLNQFSLVLKGGRLQATVRFQLWATTPNDVDLAIDDLHGRLLTAKNDLWIAGFLRFTAAGSSLAEHIPSLNIWRRAADYDLLYEFRYTDSDGAQSLIARIPIHTDPEEPNSPQRETAVITDALARWDDLIAPMLDLRGRQTVSRFTALSFIPGLPPSESVILRRTFVGAVGAPTAFADLGQWVTAVTHPTTPDRHAQLTFATFSDFLAAFNPAGSPITLGDWDEDATLDDYDALLLQFATPIFLPDSADHLQLVYQPGSTDPHFDQTAVFYIRAV